MALFSKQRFTNFATSIAVVNLTACALESSPLDPLYSMFDLQKMNLIAADEITVGAIEVFPDSTQFVCILQPFNSPELLETEANSKLLDQINQSAVSESDVRVAIFDVQFRLLSEADIPRAGRAITVSGGAQSRDTCRNINNVTVTILQFDDTKNLEFSR